MKLCEDSVILRVKIPNALVCHRCHYRLSIQREATINWDCKHNWWDYGRKKGKIIAVYSTTRRRQTFLSFPWDQISICRRRFGLLKYAHRGVVLSIAASSQSSNKLLKSMARQLLVPWKIWRCIFIRRNFNVNFRVFSPKNIWHYYNSEKIQANLIRRKSQI